LQNSLGATGATGIEELLFRRCVHGAQREVAVLKDALQSVILTASRKNAAFIHHVVLIYFLLMEITIEGEE
jgi:hypothetical protein